MNRGKRKGTAAAVAGACLAALFVATSSAHSAQATVTESAITTPTDMSYPIYLKDTPNSISVSGTSNGQAGDHVDLVCYYGSSSKTMATNVAVQANGSFSAPSVALFTPLYTPCRLRAIPSGTSPGDLTPFTGPRLLMGEERQYRYSIGSSSGKLYDYYLVLQQLAGGFDYDSLGSCAVCDGYLSEPNFAQQTITFWSNAALFYLINGPVVRSEVRVDGADAYPPAEAKQINVNASGLPPLTYSYTQNQKTGNAVIHETEPLVKCADATYPPTPTSCASFKPTGVSVMYTVTQDHSGRVAWVSAAFKSTDRKSHALDLLWDNNERFHGDTGDSTKLEYKFPGESGYAMHALADAVNLPSGPGTIFIQMQGAPEGDTATGRGAIVYDRTATQAKFRRVEDYDAAFLLHQTGTVPAHGSTRFRFAYVQGYESTQVASFAQYATTVFKGCTVPQVAGSLWPLQRRRSSMRTARWARSPTRTRRRSPRAR
jgi:hypothetical protein